MTAPGEVLSCSSGTRARAASSDVTEYRPPLVVNGTSGSALSGASRAAGYF